MKRFAIIGLIIFSIVVCFTVLIAVRVRSDKPEALLNKLRRSKGDKREQLKMKLNLCRGDVVTAMIKAYQDDEADLEFRLMMLELLFTKYYRADDERILPVLHGSIKAEEAAIRKAAVIYFNMYGDNTTRLYLLDCIDDPEPEIRREVMTAFLGEPDSDFWEKIPDEKRTKLIDNCSRKMKEEKDPTAKFLARSLVGREIEFLCTKANQLIKSADYEKAEMLIRQALDLDPNNNRAQISLVRFFWTTNKKEKALELADSCGALLKIPLLLGTPVLDGDPNDQVWQKAFRYEGKPFYRDTSRYAPTYAEGKTDFYIGHHKGTIYIAILGYEDDLNKLVMKHKERDSDCWLDDCVAFFFDPDNDETQIIEFIINPIGTLRDTLDRNEGKNFPCKFNTSIFYDRQYWACEFAVAAKDLKNHAITSDSVWGINILRVRVGAGSEQCVFWPTFGFFCHDYDRYPIAIFESLE